MCLPSAVGDPRPFAPESAPYCGESRFELPLTNGGAPRDGCDGTPGAADMAERAIWSQKALYLIVSITPAVKEGESMIRYRKRVSSSKWRRGAMRRFPTKREKAFWRGAGFGWET